jgi:DNA-binding transcriptional LysR family regulator
MDHRRSGALEPAGAASRGQLPSSQSSSATLQYNVVVRAVIAGAGIGASPRRLPRHRYHHRRTGPEPNLPVRAGKSAAADLIHRSEPGDSSGIPSTVLAQLITSWHLPP